MSKGHDKIIGIDEAGRGCGAGDVVAAAVHIPVENVGLIEGNIRDSKKMSPKKREKMYDIIMENTEHCIISIDNHTIDAINILRATKLAMLRALDHFDNVDYILVDGDAKMRLDTVIPQRQLPGGDDTSLSIAAASVLAKVFRDREMLKLHNIYPIYGWDKNKGYLTKAHLDAIETYGITEFHRTSFKRVGR